MTPTAVLDGTPHGAGNNGHVMDIDTFASSSSSSHLAGGAGSQNGSIVTTSTVTGGAATNRVLVIGSMEAAQSGAYQHAVQQAGQDGLRQVEMHMVDRLTNGATPLEKDAFPVIHVVAQWSSELQSLLPALNEALQSEGSITLDSLAPRGDAMTVLGQVRGALSMAGFASIQEDETMVSISAKKGASSIHSESNGQARSAALPLRRKLGGANKNAASAEKKKALWNIAQTSDAPLIDQDSLLTEAEKKLPSAARRDDCDLEKALAGNRKKKACKGCTCGLRELEEEEEQERMAALRQGIVKLDEDDMDMPNTGAASNGAGPTKTEVTETMVDENGMTRVIKRVRVDTKGATSSCGSCFLGDAFRCSSCPYLGLPAFKPGEKVEIPTSMDDDL